MHPQVQVGAQVLLSAMLPGRAHPEPSVLSSLCCRSGSQEPVAWAKGRAPSRSGDCDRLLGKDVFMKSDQEGATERGWVSRVCRKGAPAPGRVGLGEGTADRPVERLGLGKWDSQA